MRNPVSRRVLGVWKRLFRINRLMFLFFPLAFVLLVGCQTATPTPTPAPVATATAVPEATATVAAGATLAERYHSAGFGYSLDYPSGWVVDESDPESVSIVSPGRVAALAVIVDDLSQIEGEFTLDEYLGAWLDNSKQNFPDMEEVSRESVKLASGQDAYSIVVIYDIGDEQNFKSANIMTIKGDLAFSVEVGAKETVYDEYEDTIDAVLNSFRPGPGTPSAAATPAPQAGVYSQHGFVFQYPADMEAEEEGLNDDVANADSGLFLGSLDDEIVTLTWVTTKLYDLDGGLDGGISAMQDEFSDMPLGPKEERTVDGNKAIYQTFEGTVSDSATKGSVVVWFCEGTDQGFALVLLVREKEIEPIQDRYLDAFRCQS